MSKKQNTNVVCPYCQIKCDGWELIEDATGDRFCNDDDYLEVVCPKCKKDFYISCEVEFNFTAEKE